MNEEKVEEQEKVSSGKIDLVAVLKKAFKKEELTKFDYKVAAVILYLMASLPKTHSLTSVSNTLVGESKITKSYKGYGLCTNLKEYTKSRLFNVARELLEQLPGELCYNNGQSITNAPVYLVSREASGLDLFMLAEELEKMGERCGIDKKLVVEVKEKVKVKEEDVKALLGSAWTEINNKIDKLMKNRVSKGWTNERRFGWEPYSFRTGRQKEGTISAKWSGSACCPPKKDGKPQWDFGISHFVITVTLSPDGKDLIGWKVVEELKEQTDLVCFSAKGLKLLETIDSEDL